MVNNGIISTVKINTDYFRVGETFQIRIGEDRFVHGTVVDVNDYHVVFSYYDVCQEIDDRITFYASQIANHTNTQFMVRMTADYRNGCMIEL